MLPKLSVCIIAYNHEDYIDECINSVLNQKTDFDFEIIIGDDCSSDKTRDIIKSFEIRYPDILKTIFQKQRTGGALNYEHVHSLATGEYISHLDGDDVMLPGKIQLQIEMMEANSDINILWHRVCIFNDKNQRIGKPSQHASFIDRKISRKELILYGPFGPHSSTMYRRRNLQLRNRTFFGNDWFISVELIGDGYGLMMADVLAKYRITSNGLSAGAAANENNRKLLCRCQREIMRLYPQYNSTMALRSLSTAFLDALNFRSYCRYSFQVFLKCKAFPALYLLPKLLSFYRSSKLPAHFKTR